MQPRTDYVRRASLLCASMLAIAAFTADAPAQPTSAQQSALRSNCRSDFQSHCSGVTPGGKDALACLQKNVARLSAGCQTAVRVTMSPEPKMAAPAAAPPPPPPAATVEPAPAPKPATIVSAPPPRAKPVSRPIQRPAAAAVAPTQLAPTAPQAAAAAAPTAAQQNAMRQNCRNDFTSHCSGVQPGGKDALACLQRNVGRLSPACKKVVSTTMQGAPAAAAPAAAAAAPAAPEPAARESGPVPGGIVVSKACARYVLMHCPGMGLDMGRKVACLVDYVNAGNFVGPRCRAALKLTGRLR